MDLQRPNTDAGLRELFANHPQLRDLFINDATFFAWAKQYQQERCTLEELLVGALVWMGEEKKKLFDELIDMRMKYGG